MAENKNTTSTGDGFRQEVLNAAVKKILPANSFFSIRLVFDAVDPLFPCEEQSMNAVVDKRRKEFSAGRSAARAALAQIGVAPSAIPVGAGGAPEWPDGIVGSITHISRIAVAVIARNSCISSIGIDMEDTFSVTENLWPDILTPSELNHVKSVQPGEQQKMAAAIFSLKESFYKFQYPLTRTWLDFHDVEVEMENPAICGQIRVIASPNQRTQPADLFTGIAHLDDGLVFTSVHSIVVA